jgi:hypothetical protein
VAGTVSIAVGGATAGNGAAMTLTGGNGAGGTASGGNINLVPGTAVSTGAPGELTVNSVAGTFEVISDARLDDASASIYYGAADPALHDTVVVDYLDGNQAPTLEQQNGWSIDGVEFKVRMDAAAKALDWKTLQRNG